MITIEFTVAKKVSLSSGTIVHDHDSLGKIMEEMEKHTLLSASNKEWVELSGDYNVHAIEVIALNDEHMALNITHQEDGTHHKITDIRFYKLTTK